jgi:hypothetical protein
MSWSSSLRGLLRPPATSFPVGPNIPLSILFSNTLNLCSSRSVKDQVSRPYKTTHKVRVFKFSERRWKVKWVNRMSASITWIQSALHFFMNTVLICYCRSQVLELCNVFRDLLAISELRLWPTFWWQDITIYSFFSLFTSRATSLLASNRAIVFMFHPMYYQYRPGLQFQSFLTFLDLLDGIF